MSVTPDELRVLFTDFRQQIGRDIESGQRETNRRLDEVNDHLRILNGRVGKVEQARARLDEAVRNIRGWRHSRAEDATQDKVDRETRAEEDKALTRRELHIVLGTLGACAGFWAFAVKILPAVIKAVTP